ncbi:hypothetical protein [Dokdonella fugitiva]|uniref:Ribonucleoside-diphosphate reductase alpha chain n=1 Tax=Dokdonella fugitiva TaxID=328517 RepID=A0A4R2IGG3_9GAMM|nr:hypothetical protein [Dokdonella fugitiva]TCO43306.1 ribonucleoside-diphosphate reductase alpha chain [Dokdonella fugitiva]
MQRTTTFIDPAAVEAWDAWFRRRDGAQLRDMTVDCTWRRVADALGAARASLRQPLFAALSSWRILLDERIVASAGTESAPWPADPGAVVNAARFVEDPGQPGARFDRMRFADCAGLALRALDAVPAPAGPGPAPRPTLGVTGVADTLALLGLRYDSAPARAFVRNLGRWLAEGCWRANVLLARDEGARVALTGALRRRAGARGIAAELVADAERHGLRHAGPLALVAHPRLALLANGIADGLDPIAAAARVVRFPPDGRVVRSDGYARVLLRAAGTALPASETFEGVSIAAQLELRGVLQPWLDTKIDCAVRVARLPTPDERDRAHVQAVLLGLAEPRFVLATAADGVAVA